MSNAPELFEAGVFYYRNMFPTLEPIPAGFIASQYTWKHMPTGKTGTSEVWLDSRSNPETSLKRLTDHWSNGTWEYEPVAKQCSR